MSERDRRADHVLSDLVSSYRLSSVDVVVFEIGQRERQQMEEVVGPPVPVFLLGVSVKVAARTW